jgi:hypothetical protein
MRSMRTNILLFAASCLVMLGFVQRAAAQCAPGTQWDGIALQTGSPFQAEKVTTFTPQPERKVVPPEYPVTHIARDGQGRVRTERAEGKFKVEEGEGAGTEAVQHIIMICDPVSQKLVRLDTMSKTATVHSRPAGSLGGGTLGQGAFCSVFASKKSSGGAQKEDLGHQPIEGLDAEGVRTTRSSQFIHNGEATNAPNVSEVWCSEELGALLVEVHQMGIMRHKLETKLTKITRGEPDAGLFQIPTDYRIVERMPEEKGSWQIRSVGSGDSIQLPVPPEVHPE